MNYCYCKIGLVFLLGLFSCNKANKQGKSKSIEVAANIDTTGLTDWLESNKIYKISEKSAKDAFELGSYFEKLSAEDSLLFWHPSTDSSYYLITNYDKYSGKTHGDENMLDLRFLDVEKGIVYDGITIIDSLERTKLDFIWSEEDTFYVFTEYGMTTDIIKMKMKVDSLWMYDVEKNYRRSLK